MSYFSPSGSGGSTSSVTISGASSPAIANVSIPLANTEVSYMLPAETKRFYLSLRDAGADLKLAYVLGDSGTTYITIHRGNWYSEDLLSLSGTLTLYFQATAAGQTAEILYWT